MNITLLLKELITLLKRVNCNFIEGSIAPLKSIYNSVHELVHGLIGFSGDLPEATVLEVLSFLSYLIHDMPTRHHGRLIGLQGCDNGLSITLVKCRS